MKNITRVLGVALMLVSAQSFAQNFKFGHVNLQELVALMPEMDSANVKLEKYAKELDETMGGMQSELQTKFADYQQKSGTWTAAILEAKQRELNEMQQRLSQFQENANQEYMTMRNSLYAPIVKKASDALEKIGKDNGLTYIFDLSSASIPYVNENVSVDVMPMAKKALDIPADKKLPVPQQAQAN